MKTIFIAFCTFFLVQLPIQSQSIINLFSTTPDSSCVSTAIFFSSITNDALSYTWTFGNGKTSIQKQPTAISYYLAGNYRIGLTITTNATDKLVDNLSITAIPNTWNDGLGTDPVPDLYFLVKDASGSIIYTSPVMQDKAVPVIFNSSFLMKTGMNYTVELWEYDLIGQNDFLAYIPLNNSPSSGTFSNAGGAVTLTSQTNKTTYTSLRDIHVMPPPTVSLTQTNGVLTATMNTNVGAPFTYSWFLNNSLITGANTNTNTYTPTTSGVYRVEVFTRFTCRAVSSDINFTRVATYDLPEGLAINIGPNPTTQFVNIQINNTHPFSQKDKLVVSDILSRPVLEIKDISTANRLDISGFTNGVYVLSMTFSDRIYTLGKIVKQ